MKREYVDYWLLHSPNLKKINISKIFNIMSEIKKIGLIKNFGISVRSPLDFLR